MCFGQYPFAAMLLDEAPCCCDGITVGGCQHGYRRRLCPGILQGAHIAIEGLSVERRILLKGRVEAFEEQRPARQVEAADEPGPELVRVVMKQPIGAAPTR